MTPEYRNPADLAHWADSWEFPIHDGQPLQVVGGPHDGERVPVPVMFGQLVPQFMQVGNDVYQLFPFQMRWKFSYTIGRNWAGYRKAGGVA